MVYSGCSWFSGRLTDSRGPRFVVALGGVFLGCGIAATSQVSTKWQMYFFYGLIAAVGMSTAFIPCNATVVKWFQRKRGLALGVASSGSSCGILICPPLAATLIAQYGWRPVYLAYGVAVFVCLNIVARFMVRSPELLGLAPDGDPLPVASPNPVHVGTLTAHRRPRPRWLRLVAAGSVAIFCLWLSACLCHHALTVPAPFVHIVACVIWGFSSAQGHWRWYHGLFAFIGVCRWDRSRPHRRKQGHSSLTLHVVAFVLFAGEELDGTLCPVLPRWFFYGNVATLFSALVGGLFGRGIPAQLPAFSLPDLACLERGSNAFGYLRDVTGSYHLALRRNCYQYPDAWVISRNTKAATVSRSVKTIDDSTNPPQECYAYKVEKHTKTRRIMRYIIYGAGGVGSAIGARLFQRGHETVFICRGEHHTVLQRQGLTFKTPNETLQLPIRTVGHPAELKFSKTMSLSLP
jgi:MFS family permease